MLQKLLCRNSNNSNNSIISDDIDDILFWNGIGLSQKPSANLKNFANFLG